MMYPLHILRSLLFVINYESLSFFHVKLYTWQELDVSLLRLIPTSNQHNIHRSINAVLVE